MGRFLFLNAPRVRVGGVMNLLSVAAIAAFVFVERLFPGGQ